jgi:hypothetical protein
VRFLVRVSREFGLPACHRVLLLPKHARIVDAWQFCQKILRYSITRVDRALRQRLCIFDFTQDHRCILRALLTQATSPVALPSGEWINRGDSVLGLHFWNERLTAILQGRSLFGRGACLRHSLHASLVQLATFLMRQDSEQNIIAVYARLARNAEKSSLVGTPLGFTVISKKRTARVRIHDALENILPYALCWVFRPIDQRQRLVALRRFEIWLSTKKVLSLYRPIETSRQAIKSTQRVKAIVTWNSAGPISTDSFAVKRDVALCGTHRDMQQ